MASARRDMVAEAKLARQRLMATFVVWVVLPGAFGAVLAVMSPDRSIPLWSLVPAGVGLAVACYAAFADGAIADALCWPGNALAAILSLFATEPR